MSKKEIGNIPKIAQELVDHLPKAMDEELKTLITRAEEGHDTTIEIIDLFSKHEITRHWMKEQITWQSREMNTMPGYVRLAGNLSSIAPSQKWVCPESPRDHWTLVIQEGEDPPTCKVHRIEMVRKSE